MVTIIGDISTDYNPSTIPTTTEETVLEGTHHAPHPAITAAHVALWLMNVLIAICALTHSTGIIAPHPALTVSTADITHATIPQTRASLIPAFPTTLHRNHSQEKPSHTQDLQPPIDPTIPRKLSSRTPL